MKKSGKVILIILVLIILVLIGYIVYDKAILKNDKQTITTEKEDKTTQLDMNSEEVKDMVNKVNAVNNSCWWEAVDSYKLDEYLFESLGENEKFLTVNNYLENFYSKFSESQWSDDKSHIILNGEQVNILENGYKKVFGSHNKIIDTLKTSPDGTSSGMLTKTKEGITLPDGYGCSGPIQRVQVEATKAEKQDKDIKLYVKTAFYLNDYSEEKGQTDKEYFSTDPEGTNKIETVVFEESAMENYIKENSAKLTQYIVTYKPDSNDNYYIYSLTRVKK